MLWTSSVVSGKYTGMPISRKWKLYALALSRNDVALFYMCAPCRLGSSSASGRSGPHISDSLTLQRHIYPKPLATS